MNKKESSWADMYPELLESISDRLPLQDFVTFRSVCNKWRSAPSGRTDITKFSKSTPWYMFYDCDQRDKAICYLYHQSDPLSCTIKLPGLEGATCLMSKRGWLLALRKNDFFFYNPLSLAKIDLPPYTSTAISDKVTTTFTTDPTSRGCAVFVITQTGDSIVEISSCRLGARKWNWTSSSFQFNVPTIGRFTGAQCCSCGGDGSCRCKFKNKVYFYDPKMRFCYDHRKKTGYHQRITWPTTTTDMFADLMVVHRRHWSNKFGRDIAVSTCAVSMMLGDRAGLYSPFGKVDGMSLKGAWIEPRFHRHSK